MSLWRVRITMPADPVSQEWLDAALAGQRVLALLPPSDDEDSAGEVIIDLPRDDSLGALLNDLHVISPSVYVSSVTDSSVSDSSVTGSPELPSGFIAQQADGEGAREPALVTAGGPASL